MTKPVTGNLGGPAVQEYEQRKQVHPTDDIEPLVRLLEKLKPSELERDLLMSAAAITDTSCLAFLQILALHRIAKALEANSEISFMGKRYAPGDPALTQTWKDHTLKETK